MAETILVGLIVLAALGFCLRAASRLGTGSGGCAGCGGACGGTPAKGAEPGCRAKEIGSCRPAA